MNILLGSIMENIRKIIYLLFNYKMKLLTWTIRGAGCKGFIQQVFELIRNYHSNILVFMNTKINSFKANCIIKKLGIFIYRNSPQRASRFFEKLSPNFIMDILSIKDIFVHCLIKDNVYRICWLGTFAYGFRHHYLQKQLWQQIENLLTTGNYPWLVLADLNELSNPDKVGGQRLFNQIQYF